MLHKLYLIAILARILIQFIQSAIIVNKDISITNKLTLVKNVAHSVPLVQVFKLVTLV
jgi:hypothetical protein